MAKMQKGVKSEEKLSVYTDIDLSNYAEGTTPYAYDLELDKVIESLEKILISFFTGFRTF